MIKTYLIIPCRLIDCFLEPLIKSSLNMLKCFFNHSKNKHPHFWHGRMLHVTLNVYHTLSDVLNSGQVSLLQTQ